MESAYSKYDVIKVIINTINSMDVNGYNNCSAVVGCIQYLNRLKEGLTKEDEERNRQLETLMNKIAELEATDKQETADELEATDENSDCDD